MAEPRFDVLTIGNAIVDVIAPIDPGFLEREGLAKGIMHLVDAERSAYLYERMPEHKRQISGGSSANTAAGVASLGGRASFIGKVADDPLGEVFAEDLERIGVHYGVSRLHEGPATARSMILLSPEGERTMNTYLGACHQLTTADIKEDEIGGATVTYMEGFLWDPVEAKKAFVMAAHYAHKHERATSFTLSDPFCVNRYREEFLDLIRSKTIDYVFGNIEELKSLYQTSSFHDAVQGIARTPSSRRSPWAPTGRWWWRTARSSPCRPIRCPRWSTSPAPATFSPRASCSRWPGSATSRRRCRPGASPPPR